MVFAHVLALADPKAVLRQSEESYDLAQLSFGASEEPFAFANVDLLWRELLEPTIKLFIVEAPVDV